MKSNKNILKASTTLGLFAFLVSMFVGSATAQTYMFAYTGSVQTLTLPQVGYYEIECWGADGGDVTAGPGGGGKGGYSRGVFNSVTPGQQVFILVGGRGGDATGVTASAGAGGWNGGGGGAAVGRSGGGGGGASDVRVGGTAALNRIIVAGGGGGAAYYNTVAAGGHGGGQIAGNGDITNSATPPVTTIGGGGAGANGATPGSATAVSSNGTTTGGGGGGTSSNTGSIGQQGTGGGPGGAAGPSGSGSTGGSGGGGGGYAGGAGGVQSSNAGVAGGGGSGYVGGVSNGTTITYSQPGFVYNPEHINGVGGNGYVIIRYKCDMTAQVSKNPICAGEQVTLSTDAGSGIQWSHGPTTATVVVSPTVTTSYTVVGVSSSTTGCTNTVVLNVLVSPLPTVAAAALPTVLCQGATGTISATGATSYTWAPGNSTGNILIDNPTSSTVYTVTGESAAGCINTATVAMNVSTNQLVLSPDTAVCKGSPAYLRANGATYYNWSTGAPFSTLTVYPASTTVYTVNATDVNNCQLNGIITVTVRPLPSVSITASQLAVCRGEALQLTAGGAASYKWSNGATTATIAPETKFDLPLNFTVTGTDNNGCSGVASIQVQVNACVSIDEDQILTFRLMPNPATSGEVTLESPSQASWRILDLSGKQLLSGETEPGSQMLNISELSSGIYFVELKASDSVRTTKLIKN